jgi:hypothetical protein
MPLALVLLWFEVLLLSKLLHEAHGKPDDRR